MRTLDKVISTITEKLDKPGINDFDELQLWHLVSHIALDKFKELTHEDNFRKPIVEYLD